MAVNDLEINLYNGKHTGFFKAGNHRYHVDGVYRQGVTTILNAVLHKPALMTWPMNEALKSLGGRWTEDIGWIMQPREISAKDLTRAASAYLVRRDKGADIGSGVHALVEQFLQAELRGDKEPINIPSRELTKPFEAFIGWYQEQNNLEILGVEQVVYSEKYGVCGTFDSLLKIDGKVYLCDLKTTNASKSTPDGIYTDYFIQLAGYYQAYTEERNYLIRRIGDMKKVNTALPAIDDLLVISCKKDGKVDTASATQRGLTLKQCLGAWDSVVKLYNFRRST